MTRFSRDRLGSLAFVESLRLTKKPSWKSIIRKLTKTFLSHLGLLSALISYLCAGAAIFQSLESGATVSEHEEVDELREKTLVTLWNLSARGQEIWLANANSVLDEYTEGVEHEINHGIEATGMAMERHWTILGSLIVCITIVTTIGYGHVAPETTAGRIFCIFYALVGIPLFFVVMADIGRLFAQMLTAICQYIRRKRLRYRQDFLQQSLQFRYIKTENPNKRKLSEMPLTVAPCENEYYDPLHGDGSNISPEPENLFMLGNNSKRRKSEERIRKFSENVLLGNIVIRTDENGKRQKVIHRNSKARGENGVDTNGDRPTVFVPAAENAFSSQTADDTRPEAGYLRILNQQTVEETINLSDGKSRVDLADDGTDDDFVTVKLPKKTILRLLSLKEESAPENGCTNGSLKDFRLGEKLLTKVFEALGEKGVTSKLCCKVCSLLLDATTSKKQNRQPSVRFEKGEKGESCRPRENLPNSRRESVQSRNCCDADTEPPGLSGSGWRAVNDRLYARVSQSDSDDRRPSSVSTSSLGSRRQSMRRKSSQISEVSNDNENYEVPIYVVVLVLLVNTVAGALFFWYWQEDWSFLDSFYFTFISLTTIGFGDIIPMFGHQPSFLLAMAVYLLLGLSLVSMAIALAQERFLKQTMRIGRCLGLIRDPQEDEEE